MTVSRLCYTPPMRPFRVLLLTLLLSAAFGDRRGMAQSASPTPDFIFIHAQIYTGDGFSGDKPLLVEAMAVGQGRILATGSDQSILRLAGKATQVVDMSTRQEWIFPGFNDAHAHLGAGGETLTSLNLVGVRTRDAMMQRVAEYARSLPSGAWILRGDWDHTLWPDRQLPTRWELDKVSDGHPALLDRIDGHIAVANSAALAVAGISAQTQAPTGGAIDHDDRGEPTGILRETAKRLVGMRVPPMPAEQRRRGDELAIEDALSHGLTSIQDNSDWEDFLVYEQLEREGQLRLRITEWLPFSLSVNKLKAARAHHAADDPMLHTGMLKGFMDGSLGSRTAAMKQPFSDDPLNSGLAQYSQDQLNRMATERAKEGFQLGFHSIGDRAAAMALDAFATAEQSGSGTAARNRIEHAQVVDPVDIPRFARLGVIASMQPNHLLTDMRWARERLGPERAASSYAWKAFIDSGVRLAFGTDYPVEPITPFRGLYSAVTRMSEDGKQSYFPEARLSRGHALEAYTQGSAWAEFAEQRKGRLVPGFDADFILVDRDLYRVEPAAILGTQVLETWVAGKRVWNKKT